MPAGLGGYDQSAAVLAEEFAPYVSDAVFIGNRVVRTLWDKAQRHNEGRFLALPILTAKNNTVVNFGQNDVMPSGPQSIYSVASVPWSWYAGAVSLDYITARLVRGPNMRVDNLTVQVEDVIGSLTDRLGTDTCSLNKGPSTQHGNPLVGIPEACDDGTNVDNYLNILRLGSGSFINWKGQDTWLSTTGIGSASNDMSRNTVLRTYAATTVGDATPTHVFGHQQVIASYMFSMDAQVRVSPGDTADPYLGNPRTLGAIWIGDNHFDVETNPGNADQIGYNFYPTNCDHTKYRYFGEKGFDYLPWLDTPSVLEKLCRYVVGLACASDNPRLNGAVGPVNDLDNL